MTNLPLEIIFQIPTIIGFIWYLAKEHSAIYNEIDKHKDNLFDAQRRLESRMDLRDQQTNNDIKRIIEILEQNNKRWGIKFIRIESLLDNTITINKIAEKIEKFTDE